MSKNTKSSEYVIFFFLLGVLGLSSILLIFQLIPFPANTLSLSTPDYKGHLPLSSAIHQSKTTDNLRDIPLELKEVSQILWSLQGITHGINKRTAPSAGATYPLEIYLVHNGSSSLRRGCYNYVPQNHELRIVSSSYNSMKLISSLFGEDQDAVSNVSTVFLILADYARTTFRYNTDHPLYEYRGVQYVHLEVGHAIQNFLLQLTSLNLKSRIITDLNTEIIQDFLNTTLIPMTVLPVGINGESNSPLLKFKKRSIDNTEEMTVEQALVKRKSIRQYLDGNIPLSVILDIVKDSTKIPYLSEGNQHLDLKLVIGDVDGLINGSYNFFIKNNSLQLLTVGDLRTDLRKAGLNQMMIEKAQLDIIISVNTSWIGEQADSILYHRIMMFNIGMFAQNVYLKCASYGLGTVVVGALYEGTTAQVIDLSTTHTPIYIIPIGLTSEYYEEEKEPIIPLTDMARTFALLSYIPFYICLYLSLPVLRRKLTKKMRWIHCIIGIIPLIGVIFHFMVIHGHVRDLWNFLNIDTYFSTSSYFIEGIISFPTTRYDIGIYLANLNILLGIIAGVTGIIFAFKLVRQRKLVRRIHKYTVFSILVFMIIHALLNRTTFINNPLVFLLLNIIVIDLFFMLYLSPTVVKDIFKKKEDISSITQKE
ncbi:MAG: SagB family peptide dehydrogenase [Candidatus Heimdallarchaeota archaeon]|nr:MAG: SagB family peptide dehydrogenase [Candidatus Heimdallarchaeota archaeon]